MMIVGLSGMHMSTAKAPGALLMMCGAILLACVGVLIQCVADLILTMRQLALFRFIAGYSKTYDEAYAFVTKRKYSLLATLGCTGVVTTVSIVVGLFVTAFLGYFATKNFFFIASVVGIFVTLSGLLIFLFLVSQPSMFICPALAIEDRPFLELVGWSFQILFKTFWRTLGFVQLLTVVFLIVWVIFSVPQETLWAFDWIRIHHMGGHMSDMPHVCCEVWGNIWNSGASMLMSPFFTFCAGFYYLDVRMRAEGLDITRRLEILANPSTPTL
jgi:hypothetical protein